MSCTCIKKPCQSNCTPKPQIWCDNTDRDIEFISLHELLPRVTISARGVPDDLAIEYLREASIQLAKASRFMQRKVMIDVQSCVLDYYIQSPNEQVSEIISIHTTRNNGAHEYFNHSMCFEPQHQYLPPDKIVLARRPMQDRENGITALFYAMPTQDACEIDKAFYSRYHDGIVEGALAKISMITGFQFSDRNAAPTHERRFREAMSQAQIDSARGFSARQVFMKKARRI